MVAVARFCEEIDELGEALIESPGDPRKILGRKANLLVQSTCWANQYCADLDHAYRVIYLSMQAATAGAQQSRFV